MIAINTLVQKLFSYVLLAVFSVQPTPDVPQLPIDPATRTVATPLAPAPGPPLPLELVDLFFDFLPPTDVWTAQRICKGWHNRFWGYGQPRREQLTESELVFGPHKWRHYYGLEVTDAPPIPETILQLLDQECHIWPGRKVHDTHLLTLIPKGLTLDRLGELIQRPLNGGKDTKYKYYDQSTQKEHGDKPVSDSYWVLMTRHILPNSRNKIYDEQRALVAQQAQHTLMAYAMPSAIEAAASILTHFVQHGERLYGDGEQDTHGWNDSKQFDWWTLIHCEEKVNNNQSPVVVGGFSRAGLGISIDHGFGWNHYYGVSACLVSWPRRQIGVWPLIAVR